MNNEDLWDFREGLIDKIKYKNKSIKVNKKKEWIIFFGFIFLTWIWGIFWFVLFFWLYVYYRNITFWLFIFIFLTHFFILTIRAVYIILSSKNKKIKKLKDKEYEINIQKKIKEEKRKRLFLKSKYYLKYMNNDINNNIINNSSSSSEFRESKYINYFNQTPSESDINSQKIYDLNEEGDENIIINDINIINKN